jgi:hypothetical protein
MTERKEPKAKKGLRITMLEERKAIGGTWLKQRKDKEERCWSKERTKINDAGAKKGLRRTMLE